MRADIKSLSLNELEEQLSELCAERYRARQIYTRIHKKQAESFSEMTELSKELQESLSRRFELKNCRIVKRLCSELDDTVKYLFELNDGELTESVLLHYKYGFTACISTQAGCNMNCAFCASAAGGKKRDLHPSEMLSQVYAISRDRGVRVSRVVLMGIGEPLDNYDNVLKFISLLTDEKGQNISERRISLSSCGIVPRIYSLAKLKPQFTLSVSLHAPNSALRSKLMPVNRKWGIDELLRACRYYFEQTGRRISFEYALIDGVNDSDECASELAERLRGFPCHINLIPMNTTSDSSFKSSTPERLRAFFKRLEEKGLKVTVRRSLGADINASCGQLRRGGTDGEEG